MSAFLIIMLVLLACYACTLVAFGLSFRRMETFSAQAGPGVPVSIIICARNEQPHLANCLRTLIAQDYPRELIQVVVVNDASTDSTALIADKELENSGISYRILSNPSRRGKKRSISAAVKFAHHELIILRDADTFTGSRRWLSTVAACYAQNPGLIIGPVALADERTVLSSLQAVENSALTVVTGGSAAMKRPFLCNGANLAFPRDVFRRTRGFESHSHLVSGDDVFFLEDVKRLGDVPVEFLKSKDAVVHTYPLRSLRGVLLQKARWASKFKYNSNILNLWLAFLVFSANAVTVLAIAALCFKPELWIAALVFICSKIAVDVLLLSLASSLAAPAPAAGRVAISALLYPFYACVVGILSMFIQPVWKEE